MTTEQITAKLHKTLASIRAALARGETMNGNRLCGLIYRYDDLKAELIENDNRAVWDAYCAEQGWCPSHNGYDSVA